MGFPFITEKSPWVRSTVLFLLFWWAYQRDQCILFFVVLIPSPPSHRGIVLVLHVISLLLTNTVSPVQLAYSHMMGKVSWGPKRRRSQASQYSIHSYTPLTRQKYSVQIACCTVLYLPLLGVGGQLMQRNYWTIEGVHCTDYRASLYSLIVSTDSVSFHSHTLPHPFPTS